MVRRSAILSLLACLVCAVPLTVRGQNATGEADEELKSPLLQEPQTPEDYFDAVLLMLRLGREDLAAVYLERLLAVDPDEQTLLDLRERHGTATFLRLSRIEALDPHGRELVARLTAAATTRLNDPAYIDAMIADLSGGPREHAAAIDALKHLGPQAAAPLLRRLATPGGETDRSLLLNSIIELGPLAVGPLLGALESPQEQLQADAIEALGHLGGRDDVLPHLWYPAFAGDAPPGVRASARDAISRILYGSPQHVQRIPSFGVSERLHGEALEHLRGAVDWETGEDDLVAIWTWDASAGTVVEHRVTPESASLFRGEQFAREALDLAPNDEDTQALVLAFALASDQHRAGWDQPLPEGPGTAHNAALLAGEETVEHVLRLALDENHTAAALGALRVLGQIGTRRLLHPGPAGPATLIDALDAASPRVQFAAAATIMQVDPVRPFPHADRVVEIFARALNSAAQSKSVVVDPNVRRGGSMAGLLDQLGFETGVATTGRAGFELAAEQGDVALAVLHLNTIRWELTQTVANFRADARTKSIPIAVYGPPGMEEAVAYLMQRNQPAFYLPYLPAGDDSLDVAAIVRPMLAQITPPPLTDEQRNRQVTAAAFWLRHIAEGRRGDVFDLGIAEDALSAAVTNPAVALDALVALGGIETASAQQRLADAALAPGFDPDVRETAARQLAFHIQRYGLLLSNGLVTQLTDAARAEADPALQTALTTVVGSLKPTAEVVAERLQNLPPPQVPTQ